jgi:hypothetical protein
LTLVVLFIRIVRFERFPLTGILFDVGCFVY